jgi:hypothetical protein
MTATLKPVAEEKENIMDFADLYEELQALERRVMVQRFPIRQVKLEEYGGAYQQEEQMEKVGHEPGQEEMIEETNMSEEEAEQQLGD